MKKLGLILGITGVMSVTAVSLISSSLKDLPERDTRIIVEVDRNISTLTEEGAKNTQDMVYSNIKQVTENVRRVNSYTLLNNAFVLEVNKGDVEAIKNVPGVKSVTMDTIHWKKVINNDEVNLKSAYISRGEKQEENISATTMKKPTVTDEGEGTVVAILDNEFHLRGKLDETEAGAAWSHEVYSPLADDVALRYDFTSIKKVTGLHATRKSTAKEGYEGSLYFNNKVPFYYDYGGTNTSYGKPGKPKFDVHSEIDYHGSHVSSITAANAPTYKGIAPKAQLVLMKVFTEYNASGLGEKLGLSNSTGAYDSVILNALEDCIKLKVDGINMSLGSDLDDFDSDSITLKTLTKLNNSGILSSISAGNSGKSSYGFSGAYGNWSKEMVETGIMSSYANNKASMTVASGQPTEIYYENAFKIGTNNIAFEDQIVNRPGLEKEYEDEYRMSDVISGDKEWVYIPGFGTAADYSGLEVTDKIAVVNRGSTSFADKYSIARQNGAIALVIINNDPTASDFNFRCSFGDGFNPTMPCALVLYKSKPFFESTGSGSLFLISKEVNDNPDKYTTSSFSTDGATFDLDLKPEITAPGDNIRGAVPEHAMTSLTPEEREAIKNKAYQYLSGTSMSAPNYAGAQSLVLSKKTGPIYRELKAKQDLENTKAEEEGRTPTTLTLSKEEQKEISDYRSTVNMRLMSTADPMNDGTANPETNEITLTSPRIQGAGMVDLNGALSTDVYLESTNKDGKSKIALRNNSDIAKGNIKLTFLAHNESEEERNYDVTLTVMRPAIAHPNDLVTKDYNYMGEIDSIENLPGSRYYDPDLGRMVTASGSHGYKDVYKITKEIEYYASESQYDAGTKTKIEPNRYYNASTSSGSVDWQVLPSYTAQSVKDVVIAKVTGQVVNVKPGTSTISINQYTLTGEQKKAILDVYETGCMIEGYVTLTSKDGHEDLSIPYLGFYSGTDKDANASYESAPVSEPFNFEKDITKVYPSDFVNDITKSLIGRDNVNFESMIVAGYAERPDKIDTDKVLSNDLSFDQMMGFYKVGTDPLDNEYMDDAKNNIYVGSPDNTNTLIIQQFILRSVANNYFTIKNKDTNETVYTSALEDMLFGQSADKWALYKSHVDAGYLSAGYVAHRAYAIVPLYDEVTGEAFASGNYELTFNYLLAATGTWVNKSYNLHIDSENPEITAIKQYKGENGEDRVRIDVKDSRISYGVIGYNRVDAYYDDVNKTYYFDETKEFVDECMNDISSDSSKRLFIRAVDYARGTIGCLVHFTDTSDYSKGMTTVQASKLNVSNDFTYENDVLTILDSDGEVIDLKGKILINGEEYGKKEAAPTSGGCGGSIIASSIIIFVPSLVGAGLLIFKKKKEMK